MIFYQAWLAWDERFSSQRVHLLTGSMMMLLLMRQKRSGTTVDVVNKIHKLQCLLNLPQLVSLDCVHQLYLRLLSLHLLDVFAGQIADEPRPEEVPLAMESIPRHAGRLFHLHQDAWMKFCSEVGQHHCGQIR